MPDYAIVSEFFIKLGLEVLFGTLALFVSHDFVVVTGIYKRPCGEGVFFGSWLFQLAFFTAVIARYEITLPNSFVYTLSAGVFFGVMVVTSAKLQWKFARRWGYV